MNTWHIHIGGQVQGVGFRPFVFLLAKSYGINGWVNNAVDGVHIVFNASDSLAALFKQDLIKQAPELSNITSVRIDQVERKQVVIQCNKIMMNISDQGSIVGAFYSRKYVKSN